ncbi:MAG: hypothetical protein C5S47_06890 [Candidatus Methanogasteraceae archaeon]|nr:MAG: hypothetical protein C5S47_06890 [ANME-2 cluster archaeon]
MRIVMELKFNREQNRRERLAFIKRYSEWVKSVPNEVWSQQQTALINSFLNSSKDFQLSRSEYLLMKDRSKAASLRHRGHHTPCSSEAHG